MRGRKYGRIFWRQPWFQLSPGIVKTYWAVVEGLLGATLSGSRGMSIYLFSYLKPQGVYNLVKEIKQPHWKQW